MSTRSAIQPDEPLKEIVIHSTLAATKGPEHDILEEVESCGYGEEDVFAIKLAVEEALSNAVCHGNCNDPAKTITVRYRVTPEKATIIIRDEGCGFCPDEVPDPTAPENLESPRGRGIMLMRAYMSDVCYNQRGNEVTLVKVNRA
jgi:serine/threonine-protein kinase RsbW